MSEPLSKARVLDLLDDFLDSYERSWGAVYSQDRIKSFRWDVGLLRLRYVRELPADAPSIEPPTPKAPAIEHSIGFNHPSLDHIYRGLAELLPEGPQPWHTFTVCVRRDPLGVPVFWRASLAPTDFSGETEEQRKTRLEAAALTDAFRCCP